MKCSPFISKWRYRAVLFGTVGIFCIMLWRLYDLHIIESKNSKDAVQSQRQIVSPISAKRGNITDARGNILATSRSVIDLGVDPEAIKEKFDRPETQEKLSKMAHILNLPLSEILEKCKSEEIISPSGRIIKRRWKLIAKVEENVYEEISALKIYGITGDRKYVRTYPSEGLAAHVIGFVNKEGVAVDGIEKNADWYLKGQEGWIQSEKDARRRELAHFRTREVPATDGMNIELSIDIIIQEMANRQLQKIVEEFNPENATIIVSDPATGFILALANYPSFDPNNYNKYPVANLKNFALSSQIEPGSTFKIVPISAALNEGLVTQDDTFDCAQPTLTHRGRILKLPPDDHPAGVLSVRQIAEKSSNRGSAQLGAMLGEQKLFEYAKMFGYGSKTNIGLSGEINGVLMNPKNWDGLTITRLPMGHAVAATPLQIHCSMATLANQGVYMRPQLVKRIFSEKTGKEIVFAPKRLRQVVSPKTASIMCDILTDVTEKGTGKNALVSGFKVAGKTGTAQKIIDGKYSKKQHVGSFSGFFPSDRPRLVITVIVDDAKRQNGRPAYGSVVAAPAFANIAKEAASYLGIQTDEEFENIIALKDWE